MSTKAQSVEMRLEIVVVPVSDVDRAKRFYDGLGWRLDADFAAGDDFRVIQFTPPGSGCSVIFGKNVTAAASMVLIVRSPRSAIRTAMAGCSRKSPRDCPDAWIRRVRHSPL
jgi:catechol 2,3-dioxygenase-like lactoylglutathione lyase family enzyme